MIPKERARPQTNFAEGPKGVSMKTLIATLGWILPALAFAGSSTYTVSGMTCKSCVKAVKAQVCHLDGVAKCEVTVGKVVLTPKPGAKIDDLKVSKAIERAGDFQMTGSPAMQ